MSNEPAFPLNELNQTTGDICAQHFGITLRDYFAANADMSRFQVESLESVALIAGRPMPENDQIDIIRWQFELVANMRYLAADAMLKARES